MAQIDLGKLKFQWKGAYADSTAYEIDDVVYYAGSAYVCTTVVANSNTTDPNANSSFAVMQQGLNNTGAYNANTTYYFNDIVTYNNASYIRKNTTASSGVVPTTTATWLALVGAPPGSVMTTAGDIEVKNNEATTIRLPIGSKNQVLTATEDVLESFANGDVGVDYIVNSGKANLEIVGTSTNVGGGDASTNATITLTRGKPYKFVFPANGNTYSIKDTTVSGYETGTTGRLTTAQGVNVTSVSNGGTILFTPSESTTTLAATTVAIRDESSSATTDFVNITLVPQRFTPQWKENNTNWGGWMCPNNDYNTHTDSLDPLPLHLRTFGRGGSTSGNYKIVGYRQGGYISVNGNLCGWGNHYSNGEVYIGYGAWGFGGVANQEDVRKETRVTQFRMPNFWFKALAGNSDYAKFLTDLDGNSLGYTNASSGHPKVLVAKTSSTQCMILLENGMVFHTGYNGLGARGNSTTTPHSYSGFCVPWWDENGNLLTGTNIPKITQIAGSIGSDEYGTIHWYMALDSDGYVYTWGDGAHGKLGHGASTDRSKAQRLDPDLFAVGGTNKKIIYIATGGRDTQGTTYAIDEDGRLWGWGANGNGALGIGNKTDQTAPQNISDVTSSPLNNKVVTHVCGCWGDKDNQGKTWILTSEGKVYYTGFIETYGLYSGHYIAAGTDVETPVEIYDAANTINSAVNGTAQKAITIWPSGGEHGCVFIQTDGGGTPSEPKVYAAGSNAQGQLGSGGSQTHGMTSSSAGNWTLQEIQFDDAGSTHSATAGGDPGDRQQGTQWSSTIKDAMSTGKIVKIIGSCYTGKVDSANMALDDKGIVYWTGSVDSYNLINYYENDAVDDGAAAVGYVTRWCRVWQQPEPMVDIIFNNLSGDTNAGWTLIGESGTVYSGGYHGWGANNSDVGNHGLNPIPLSTQSTGSKR